jgi:hypothetical protein
MPGVIIARYTPGPPETLWHYTSAPGFRGIVTSRALWASDTLRMTDPTEFSYPREVLVRVLDRMEAASDDGYERWVLAIAKVVATAESGPMVYAACVSEAQDRSSQWGTFAARGSGFAVGLDRRTLHAAAAQQDYSLCPLIYDVLKQEAHYERQFRTAIETIPGVEAELGRDVKLALLLGISFSYVMTIVKNHRYASEGEWRLLRLDEQLEERPPPKVRGSGVHYEEVALLDPTTGECAITEVMAGPAASSESIEEARDLLDRCGLGHVPLHRSTIAPGSGD